MELRDATPYSFADGFDFLEIDEVTPTSCTLSCSHVSNKSPYSGESTPAFVDEFGYPPDYPAFQSFENSFKFDESEETIMNSPFYRNEAEQEYPQPYTAAPCEAQLPAAQPQPEVTAPAIPQTPLEAPNLDFDFSRNVHYEIHSSGDMTQVVESMNTLTPMPLEEKMRDVQMAVTAMNALLPNYPNVNVGINLSTNFTVSFSNVQESYADNDPIDVEYEET